MPNPIKATRATIELGDIPVDVFQLPSCTYRYGYDFLALLIERDKSILSNKKSPFHILKLLKSTGTIAEHSQTVKVEEISQSYRYNTLSETDLIECLDTLDDLGFKIAKKLMKACTLEALERRADAAFGIIRTEEERNQRLITRRDSIISRHFWADCIEHYMKHNDVSDNYRKWIYHNVSDCINLKLFGLTSKQLRDHYGCGDQSPRDWLPSDTLKLIDSIEKAVGVRVKKTGAEPKQALKDMLGFMGIEPDSTLL